MRYIREEQRPHGHPGDGQKMETVVKDTHLFISTETGHRLPVIQSVCFLE